MFATKLNVCFAECLILGEQRQFSVGQRLFSVIPARDRLKAGEME
jgi:hypothetical protein